MTNRFRALQIQTINYLNLRLETTTAKSTPQLLNARWHTFAKMAENRQQLNDYYADSITLPITE